MISYIKGAFIYVFLSFISVPLLHLSAAGLVLLFEDSDNFGAFLLLGTILFSFLFLVLNFMLFKGLKESIVENPKFKYLKQNINIVLTIYCIIQISLLIYELKTGTVYWWMFKK